MKEIRETKLVEQTTVKFVADDGTEFETERDCVEYERRCNSDKCHEAYQRLHPKWLDIPFVDWNEHCYVEMVSLSCEKDFDTLIDYVYVIGSYACANLKKPDAYPCTKIVVYGEGWVDEYAYEITALKKNLLDIVKTLQEKEEEING